MQVVNYQVDSWQRKNWQKGSRYYCCELRQNLFSEWVVVRQWGRITAPNGQSLEHVCSSYEEGLGVMSKVERRRLLRGYRDISSV